MYYNFKKHRHFNSIKSKNPYLSWKQVRHKKRNFTISVLKDYLNNFWYEFNRANQQRRLELLEEASKQKFKYLFNYYKNLKKSHKMSGAPCRVCKKTPTLTHHVILLKNGGINKHCNYIRLCEFCHAKIHPWLLGNVLTKMNNKIDEELDLVCSLSNT